MLLKYFINETSLVKMFCPLSGVVSKYPHLNKQEYRVRAEKTKIWSSY